MKFYLAAGFSRKHEIADKAAQLQRIRIGVTSTWPWEDATPQATLADLGPHHLIVNGTKDIAEIDAADGVILFTQDPTIPFLRGGRMHEFGYAHGKGKSMIVCGPRENIFHYLPCVEVIPTWEELLNKLEAKMEEPKCGLGGAPTRATTLPDDAKSRKTFPIASGFMDYFPDAIVAVSKISYQGNEQHNPGQPIHWARSKSSDEADTMLRHFLQRGTLDVDGARHTAKMCWRALALLQKEIEESKKV